MKKPFVSLFKGTLRLYAIPMLVLFLVFCVGMLLAVFLPVDAKMYVFETVGEKFQNILGGANTDLQLTWSIFKNNLIVSLIMFTFGFGVVLPVILMLSNGIIIGLFLALIYRLDSLSPGMFATSVISLIPHGIFELTAFFLAGSISIMVVLKAIFNKKIEPSKQRRQVLLEAVGRFVFVIVPLLVVAALVEVYISNSVGEVVGKQFTMQQHSDLLSVELNPDFLLEHNCVVNPELPMGPTDNIADSLVSMAKVVYHKPTYLQLQQRKGLPFWDEQYLCADDLWISVQTWSNSQWNVQQAARLRVSMFQAAETEFSPNANSGTYSVTVTPDTDDDALNYIDDVISYNDKTISLQTNDRSITSDELFQ